MQAAGHSVAWGRGTDGRTTFFWARVTPRGTVVVRTVTAADAQTLMEKAGQAAGLDAEAQLVASFSDPLRSCSRCGAEMSFDGAAERPLACPRGAGHDFVVPV
jgi:hypothetical protein